MNRKTQLNMIGISILIYVLVLMPIQFSLSTIIIDTSGPPMPTPLTSLPEDEGVYPNLSQVYIIIENDETIMSVGYEDEDVTYGDLTRSSSSPGIGTWAISYNAIPSEGEHIFVFSVYNGTDEFLLSGTYTIYSPVVDGVWRIDNTPISNGEITYSMDTTVDIKFTQTTGTAIAADVKVISSLGSTELETGDNISWEKSVTISEGTNELLLQYNDGEIDIGIDVIVEVSITEPSSSGGGGGTTISDIADILVPSEPPTINTYKEIPSSSVAGLVALRYTLTTISFSIIIYANRNSIKLED